MVAMVVSGSGSEGDRASLCSNVYAMIMKHWSNNQKFHTHKAEGGGLCDAMMSLSIDHPILFVHITPGRTILRWCSV